MNKNNICPVDIHVITLKNTKDYIQSDNYKSLKTITNNIKLSKGIILDKQQSDKYFLYAKSSIGITLAHLN